MEGEKFYISDLGVPEGIEILMLKPCSSRVKLGEAPPLQTLNLPSLQTFVRAVSSAWSAFPALVFPAYSPSFKAQPMKFPWLSLNRSLAEVGGLN